MIFFMLLFSGFVCDVFGSAVIILLCLFGLVFLTFL